MAITGIPLTGVQVSNIVPITEEAPNAIYTNMVSKAFSAFYNKDGESDYKPLVDQTKPKFNTANYSGYNKENVPKYNAIIQKYATKYDMDPLLVESTVKAESNGRSGAKSNKGALGLMQIMPATAAEIARELGRTDYNILDPETNIEFGTYYLKKMMNKFNGDISKGLAAYNAGAQNVIKYNGVPPFEETQKYVTKVLNNYKIGTETTKDMDKLGLRRFYINKYEAILHPSIADKIMRANELMMQQTGKGIQINSSYRSYSQQEEIYNRSEGGKKFKAARPGKSNHQYGRAIDVQNWKEAAPYLKQVGLINPMADDRVHFSETGR